MGSNFFLLDQGSKLPSVLGSGIKILGKKMGSFVKNIYLVTTLRIGLAMIKCLYLKTLKFKSQQLTLQ